VKRPKPLQRREPLPSSIFMMRLYESDVSAVADIQAYLDRQALGALKHTRTDAIRRAVHYLARELATPVKDEEQ